MAKFRTYASRLRLRVVWMLTRHPKFRPLYYAEVVSPDPLGQAEFLLQAGYHQAAGALARGAIEGYLKRLALICPNWGRCRAVTTNDFAGFLHMEGAFDSRTKNLVHLFYSRASKIVHMRNLDRRYCVLTIEDAKTIKRRCEEAAQLIMAGGLIGGAA